MSETPQPAEGQCAFYLPRKKRFCRFRPNQGQKYCAEHATVLGVELERKRIVCPLNPKHTCYEDNLAKHLKKCNSRKGRTEVYYEEGINTGSDEGDVIQDAQTAVKATSTSRLKQMIEKVNQLYEEHIGKLEEDIRSHECLHEEMDNPYYGTPALRHRRQQASLIGQLDCLGLLEPGHCYVEMGAGKGQLSHWVRKAVSNHDDAAFLLVDRSSIRYKVDGYHKEEEKVQFERIKIDIEHLNLGKVPMISNSDKPLVAMGKHLCGAATDLTLRCLMQTGFSSPSQPDNAEPSAKKRKVDTEILSANSHSLTNNSDVQVGDKTIENLKCDTTSQTDIQEQKIQESECIGSSDFTGLNSAESKGAESNGEALKGNAGCCLDANSTTENHNRLSGVLIALCCHHQCRWKAYVGKDFMRRCGISASDFGLLTRLTSWAVCGWRDKDGSFSTKQSEEKKTDSDSADTGKKTSEESTTAVGDSNTEENEHDTRDLLSDSTQGEGLQLSEKQKETVGWKCKRLIDHGRALYLRSRGLHSRLKVYIDAQQTPENVVLIATPSRT